MMADSLWKLLLQLKEKVYASSDSIDCILLTESNIIINPKESHLETDILILFHSNSSNWNCTQLKIKDNGLVQMLHKGKNTSDLLNELYLFLPFCVAPLLVKDKKKALSISHFAQSIDGYIATTSKHSKWIGNEENLIHSHRIRALVDGVIIGNNTLKEDQPKLTVRHVDGNNPVRVIIGNTTHSEASLTECCDARIFRFMTNEIPESQNDKVEYIKVSTGKSTIPTSDVLTTLYDKGIYSVLIEGGSYTSSIFQMEKNLDIIQLHISPMLFGSGIKAFNLPSIQKVDDSSTFEHHFYHPVGDAIMFTGYIESEKEEE